MKKWFKRLFISGILLVVAGIAFTLLVHWRVSQFGERYSYNSIDEIPAQTVGLVLGTSKYLGSGYQNLYFKYRVEAAAELFRAGKIKYIVVSGDNHHQSYNEPQDMKESLMELGVPADRIYLDYAGFRTLDSVVRCSAIFGQQQFTIISQPFHNYRALYIAHKKGLKPIAYNATAISGQYGKKTRLREYLARVKMALDVHLLGTQPKFYGEPIEIGLPQAQD